MRNPHGYLVINDPDKPLVEYDTVTCCHCNKVTIIPHRCDPSELGGFCTMCMGYTCKDCADKDCTPFEKKLEQMEAKDRFLRSVYG
jgi:hypothetical protein